MSTNIEWTDVTDNIIVAEGGGWWCRKKSPGCTNCYAEKLNQSAYFHGNKLKFTGDAPPLRLRTEIIDSWARQRKAKRHFVASMTDVFGDWVPYEWARTFLRGMWRAPRQTFQILTKRPEVMRPYVARWLTEDGLTAVPPNIWLGTSVEDEIRAYERIPELLQIPCAVRFLSCEPLLGHLDLYESLKVCWKIPSKYRHFAQAPASEVKWALQALLPVGWKAKIQWVICGGESGKNARPMHPDWPRSLRDQCAAAGVAFFFKQWGEWAPHPHPPQRGVNTGAGLFLTTDGKRGCQGDWWDGAAQAVDKVGKKAAGKLLDGVAHKAFPEVRA